MIFKVEHSFLGGLLSSRATNSRNSPLSGLFSLGLAGLLAID